MPPKLSFVGVFMETSSILESIVESSEDANLVGRGVVGVDSSSLGGGSVTVRVVLTARKPDIAPELGFDDCSALAIVMVVAATVGVATKGT